MLNNKDTVVINNEPVVNKFSASHLDPISVLHKGQLLLQNKSIQEELVSCRKNINITLSVVWH